MEIDTAVRHGAKAVFIVSNNAAWNIERYDQEMNYGGRVVGTMLAPLRLRRHGPRARRCTASGSRSRRNCAGALERALANAPALVDVVTSQTVVSSDAQEGPRLRARLPGADRLGRCRAQAARRLGAAGHRRSGRNRTGGRSALPGERRHGCQFRPQRQGGPGDGRLGRARPALRPYAGRAGAKVALAARRKDQLEANVATIGGEGPSRSPWT